MSVYLNRGASIENATKQIFNLIGSKENEIFQISAKTGEGVKNLLLEIPNLISPPEQKTEGINALIFDSFFDSYRGVVASVRVFGDEIPLGHKIAMIDLKEGDTILKYGHDIGKVVKSIKKGEHVHVHNVKTKKW